MLRGLDSLRMRFLTNFPAVSQQLSSRDEVILCLYAFFAHFRPTSRNELTIVSSSRDEIRHGLSHVNNHAKNDMKRYETRHGTHRGMKFSMKRGVSTWSVAIHRFVKLL